MSTSTLEIIPAAEAPDLTLMPRADLPAIWGGYDKQKEPLTTTAASIIAADPALPVTQKLAKTTRLAIRRLRIDIDHTREELVGGFKKITSAIDKKAREFKTELEPIEEQLFQIEQYAEIQEAKRVAALIQERTEYLAQFPHASLAQYRLENMSQEQFDTLFAQLETEHFAKLKKDKEEAEARAAKAKADAEDRARIIAENDRLKAEAQAQAAKATAEREQAEAATRAERQARERVEAELRQKEAADAAKRRLEEMAEAARKRAEQAAARKAANAPDSAKMLVLVEQIGALAEALTLSKENATLETAVKACVADCMATIERKALAL